MHVTTLQDDPEPRSLFRQFLAPFGIGLALSLASTGVQGVRFGEPFHFLGDHLFLLNWIANFFHGNSFYSNPSLGFPSIQDYTVFPSFDLSSKIILYLLSLMTSNMFVVVGWYYLVGVTLVFCLCFLSLRLLDVSPWLAAAAGVAYVASPFFASRALFHDFLALYFSVPLAAVVPLLFVKVADQLPQSVVPRWVLVSNVVLVSTSGLYYAFFATMFMIVGGVAGSLAARKANVVVVALASSAAILSLLILTGYGPALLSFLRGGLAQPARQAFEQLTYGIPLGSAFTGIPFGFGSARDYLAAHAAALPDSFNQPEWPGLVLTTVILCAPIVLVAVPFMKPTLLVQHRMRVTALAAALTCFGLLFAASGGFGFMFNLLITPEIRAQARIMPFLQFYALVLLCLGSEIGAARFDMRFRVAFRAAAALALLVSAYPYIGTLQRVQRNFLNSSELQENIASVRRMLAAKDGAGLQTILQLPHVYWPEAPRMAGFDTYQHLLPFILDRPDSQTRWSYGQSALQPTWDPVVAALGPEGEYAELPRRAAALGFDGLLVEKAAYSPEQITQLSAAFDGLCRLFEDRSRTLYGIGKKTHQQICVSQ